MIINMKSKRKTDTITTDDLVIDYNEETRTITLLPSNKELKIKDTCSCEIINKRGVTILSIGEVK